MEMNIFLINREKKKISARSNRCVGVAYSALKAMRSDFNVKMKTNFEISQTIYHDFVQIFSLPSCFHPQSMEFSSSELIYFTVFLALLDERSLGVSSTTSNQILHLTTFHSWLTLKSVLLFDTFFSAWTLIKNKSKCESTPGLRWTTRKNERKYWT